jgi:hypothetical protein
MIGVDYVRTFNPGHRQGTAVGIVNVAGFTATLLVSLAVGVLLGVVAGPSGYTPEAFRLAWTVQYVVWAIALGGVLVARRRARRKMAAEGVVGAAAAPGEPPPRGGPPPPLRRVLAARLRPPARVR